MRALAVACEKLGVPASELSEDRAMDTAEVLVPMLRTLLGKQAAMSVRRQIVFPEEQA
jgi:hypothetical protein